MASRSNQTTSKLNLEPLFQLRRMQGFLQADRPEGLVVRLPGGAKLHHRQAAEEPVPVLPLPEVSGVRHEERGGPRGAPEECSRGGRRAPE